MTLTKNHLAALCIIGAAAVGYSGHDGWGWLVFLAFLLAV